MTIQSVSPPRPLLRRAVALLALAGGLLLASEPTHAGVYTATNCSNVSSAAPNAVSSTNTTVYPRTTDCVGGDDTGMRITNSGGIGPGYAYGAWSWYAPPGTIFSDLFFRFKLGSSAGHGSAVTASNGATAVGVWTVPPFPSGWVAVDTVPLTATSLTAWLECAANCPQSSAHTYIKDLFFAISDYTAPRITSLGGALLGGGVRRGSEDLHVVGSDNANLHAVTVRANGVVVAERQNPCSIITSGPAVSFHPCPSTGAWTIPINTELLPDGDNSIEVCASDLSSMPWPGTSRVSRRVIQVDNSCPSSGGTQATSLEAGLQAGNGPVGRGSAWRPTRVPSRGDLGRTRHCRRLDRVPLRAGGAPGDGRELVDTARVRSDGGFALDADPGPSRLLDVVYRYNNQVVEKERLQLESIVMPAFKVVGRRNLGTVRAFASAASFRVRMPKVAASASRPAPGENGEPSSRSKRTQKEPSPGCIGSPKHEGSPNTRSGLASSARAITPTALDTQSAAESLVRG